MLVGRNSPADLNDIRALKFLSWFNSIVSRCHDEGHFNHDLIGVTIPEPSCLSRESPLLLATTRLDYLGNVSLPIKYIVVQDVEACGDRGRKDS